MANNVKSLIVAIDDGQISTLWTRVQGPGTISFLQRLDLELALSGNSRAASRQVIKQQLRRSSVSQ